MLHFTTNECLVEDNIFNHLRHSMILQAGANGNIFSYNYSYDPYWTGVFFPANSAGEIVLHGNWPYANLFEGNDVGNIVIDNSHDANGPHNTFLEIEQVDMVFSLAILLLQDNTLLVTKYPMTLFLLLLIV